MDLILGIDLGTTNSAAAVYRDGRIEMIEEDGQTILPSVVGLDEQGQLLVGTPARNQEIFAPERTVRSIKRKMGQEVTIPLRDSHYTPQEISAMILRTLKQRAERQLGQPIRKAVITVPAFFNETQRQATQEAGELAELDVVRIINEPTAAALTYEPHSDRRERLLVYDLGGGTFDVSIVQIEQGVVEVLASHGDTQLGGDDFDQLLLEDVCTKFKKKNGVDPRDSLVAKSRLLQAVEAAKKTLSDEPVAALQEEFLIDYKGSARHLDMELSRLDYEEMIEPMLTKTLGCLDDALKDADLHAQDIDYVVLVGGASRTPLVHRLLQERLGQPLHMEVNPDLCVAMGAAVQGALIAGIDAGPVLVDITPHTLGIQSHGDFGGFESSYLFSPIIERNTPLPVSRSELFHTMSPGQKVAQITVFQGENEDVRYNEEVGDFRLEGLADVDAGNAIQVRFTLDLNGILTVNATERLTNLEKKLVIESAMERFRQSNRQEAQDRMRNLFGDAPPTEWGKSTDEQTDAEGETDEEQLPEEIRPLVQQARTMLARGEQLLSEAGSEDASELKNMMQQLETAVANRSEAEIKKHFAALEDLVFYLQDE